jgi:magnesium-transporting ATPase (P-type)
MVITGDILFELFFVFICRNEKIFGKGGAFSNRYIFYGVIISIIFHLGVLYTFANKFFEFTPLTLNQWTLVLPFSLSGLVLFGIGRWIKKRKMKDKEK